MLSFVVEVMLTFVAVWVAIFGSSGALLARARGGHSLAGFAQGALLGPFGWCTIWWLTRSGKAVDIDDWLDCPGALAPEQDSRATRF